MFFIKMKLKATEIKSSRANQVGSHCLMINDNRFSIE
jgi:hypothetical protein